MLIPVLAAALVMTPAPAPEYREPVPQVSVAQSRAVAQPELILEVRTVANTSVAARQDVVREGTSIRTLVTIVLLAVAVGALIVVAL